MTATARRACQRGKGGARVEVFPPDASAGRVLLADPCPDTVESTALLLGLWGYQVWGVGTGPDALEAVGAVKPDAVVMEVALPELNGWEVAARLRRLRGRRILLLALTGLGGTQAQARSREAGFDGHLLKPAEPEALRAWLASMTRT